MKHQPILARLAPLVTNQTENVATDALSHLLLQYDGLRSEFFKFLSESGSSLPPDLQIKTQARWQDDSIPDLVGLDDEDDYRLIVEAKFGAPLTKNQPATYLRRLKADKSGMLLFIVPGRRANLLWLKILGRLSASNTDSSPNTTDHKRLHVHLINGDHLLVLATWEALLDRFIGEAIRANNADALCDVRQLKGLCDKLDEDAYVPISENELITPTQGRITQFRGIINDAVYALKKDGKVSTDGYSASPGPNYYRRYFRFYNLPREDWSLEYNNRLKVNNPDTSIWLSLNKSRMTVDIIRGAEIKTEHLGKRLFIPLTIPAHMEYEDVIQSLFDQVSDISNRLEPLFRLSTEDDSLNQGRE